MDIISPMEIVTLAFQLPPVIISSAIFDRNRYKYSYKTSERRVHRHLVSKLATGYRNVSCRDTSRYNFQRYIFQNKINFIGHDVNGMYLVTLVFQFAPGNLKVGVSVTSRYNFQCHVCKNLIQIHLYNVKETCA